MKRWTVEIEEVAHYSVDFDAEDYDEARGLAETMIFDGEYVDGEVDRDVRIIYVQELEGEEGS